MKTRVYFEIALRIIILFSMGMLMSYVRPELRDFLGDIRRISPEPVGIDMWYDWGAVHYWFFWMCVALFILSAVNFIMSIIKIVEKHYD